MASIFTFDHEPPRVDSPWRSIPDVGTRPRKTERAVSTGVIGAPDAPSAAEVQRLEAEPQDGPVEYKLHLLLRPRRPYNRMSTTLKPTGSHVAKHRDSRSPKEPPPLAASKSSRENRLQHLTTQLLWRLMQSSPHHGTARRDLVVPRFPEDSTDLARLQQPAKLLPGLESSNGALYELGVADDGTLVGLTKDEMDESMNTLKLMAASLGCKVEVQRMQAVGNCEWTEDPDSESSKVRREDLWVAEALVMPILNGQGRAESQDRDDETEDASPRGTSTAKELRISLIGTTTSGKTSLLGTLAHGTQDNGNGLSRTYVFNHRHEVASGRTSSVAQELIGYEGKTIVNYHVEDVNEWTDIHNVIKDGRLVHFLDSAGYLRYHRTTLRALVGWAPHWTLLCIAAVDECPGPSGTEDITMMDHLDLCLNLGIPFAIVITKFDLVQTKEHLASLKSKLEPVLSKVKAAGRALKQLNTSLAPAATDLAEVPDDALKKVQAEVVDIITAAQDPLAIVPIIWTSVVKGIGIGMMHALLGNLPVPSAPTAQDLVPGGLNPEQPMSLFHIDGVFERSLGRAQAAKLGSRGGSAPVVTGHVRFGRLSIGDKVVLGPFPPEEEESDGLVPNDRPSPGYGLSIPDPSSAQFARLNSRNILSATNIEGEWRNATIYEIRELRLPVQTMESGQSGSIQIVFDEPDAESGDLAAPAEAQRDAAKVPTIRRGQVLAIPSRHMADTGLSLQASTKFVAAFKDEGIQSLQIGGYVHAYFGMVRAMTRVVSMRRDRTDHLGLGGKHATETDGDDDVFGMRDHFELERSKSEADLDRLKTEYHVSLKFVANREWIELGAQIVLFGGGSSKDKSGGLDGFVGKVIEIAE